MGMLYEYDPVDLAAMFPRRAGERCTVPAKPEDTRAEVETMPIALHDTGHTTALDGRLVRVDLDYLGWIATRYNADMSVHDTYRGTDQQVHSMAEHWRRL